MRDPTLVALVDYVAKSCELIHQLEIAISKEADIPNEVILALSNLKAEENRFNKTLDLVLASVVTLN
jgi:hypothetical protein